MHCRSYCEINIKQITRFTAKPSEGSVTSASPWRSRHALLQQLKSFLCWTLHIYNNTIFKTNTSLSCMSKRVQYIVQSKNIDCLSQSESSESQPEVDIIGVNFLYHGAQYNWSGNMAAFLKSPERSHHTYPACDMRGHARHAGYVRWRRPSNICCCSSNK